MPTYQHSQNSSTSSTISGETLILFWLIAISIANAGQDIIISQFPFLGPETSIVSSLELYILTNIILLKNNLLRRLQILIILLY